MDRLMFSGLMALMVCCAIFLFGLLTFVLVNKIGWITVVPFVVFFVLWYILYKRFK